MKIGRRGFLAGLLAAPFARALVAKVPVVRGWDFGARPAVTGMVVVDFSDVYNPLKRVYPVSVFEEMCAREAPFRRLMRGR